ncbi:hypothetical protein NQ314_014483 [Rhamnusium bicolor]|uniref:FACT complex subunit SSRP1 n=1 Tax=Rhamnusium bicolor TaxID=1586634 RepID=A0AAV8X1U4_9CUCU|nr:hypothetical protein NQ314_014483 [Rhamnusium bicolor]
MDFLEYSDISAEIKGCMTPGKLKMTDQNIIFKNSKTGKVEQIPSSEFDIVNFQNFAGSWERELSMKGWNWGTAKFTGSVLSFDIGHSTAFEIPLNHVSQCTAGKNEITMEFHQNDDAPVSLMEMRFFIPSNELAGDVDPVEAFQQQVMDKASVINVSGDAIAIFREIHYYYLNLSFSSGRYDIKIFNTFFQLHGKTFDYKIPMTTVLRLFILPHKDSRQMFFVVSLDPPIKQGQTRYHFLVLLFNQEDETSIELPFTEEELKEKYEGKLEKEVSGPTYEVLGKVMKNIINRKLTGPGAFIGHSGTPAIGCSFKAAAGLLYPLERGFIYVHKPPIHIRFEEINSVNFARSGGSTRSFDFEVELKSGTVHTFSSIEKEEYAKLFDFITCKKLNIKNRGKNDKASIKDDFGNSDDEAAPDAYLERVKAEAQERDDGQSDDDDESTDEDFNPNQDESDVAEEYDTDHSSSSEEDEEGGGSDGEKKEKKHKKDKKEKKKTKTVSEKPRRRREKKEKDDNKPKRATSAFMLWLNENREKIKQDNEGIKFTEIAKKGGEMWRELKDKSEWEAKANKEKERKKRKKDKKPAAKKSGPSPQKSDDLKIKKKAKKDDKMDSENEEKKSAKKDADDEDKGNKRKKDSDDEKAKKKAKSKKESDDEEEEIEETPPSSEGDESD